MVRERAWMRERDPPPPPPPSRGVPSQRRWAVGGPPCLRRRCAAASLSPSGESGPRLTWISLGKRNYVSKANLEIAIMLNPYGLTAHEMAHQQARPRFVALIVP